VPYALILPLHALGYARENKGGGINDREIIGKGLSMISMSLDGVAASTGGDGL